MVAALVAATLAMRREMSQARAKRRIGRRAYSIGG